MLRLFFIATLAFSVCSCQTSNETVDKTEITAIDSVTADAPTTLQTLNEKIRKEPSNPELYFDRAVFHMDNRTGELAMADLKRALLLDSTNCKYLTKQADVFFSLGQSREARDVLNKCIDNNSKYEEAYLKLAEIYLLVAQHDKSIEYINTVLDINVNNAKAYFMKGVNYKYMRDTAKATSSMQTAVEQDPEYYDAYIELGLLYAAKNDELAVAYYNNALKINPNSLEGLYNRSYYWQEHNKQQEAIDGYLKMIDINPNSVRAHYNIGYVNMYYLKNFKEGSQWFSAAIELEPKYIDAWYNRGFCYEHLNELQKAEADYRQALKLNPQYTLAAKGVSRVVDGEY